MPARVQLLASDGIWEFLSNEEVCEIVASHTDPLAACKAIVAEAYRLWMQYDGRGTDDITVVLLMIDGADDATDTATTETEWLGTLGIQTTNKA